MITQNLSNVPTAVLLGEIERRKSAMAIPADARPENGLARATVDLIARAGEIYNVRQQDILGTGRWEAVAAARFAVWLRLREAGYTYALIGAAFRRDHTTILHGCARGRTMVEMGGKFAEHYRELERK